MKAKNLLLCTVTSVFLFSFSCSKDDDLYDPSGKCGFVVKAEQSPSGAWLLTVDMEDGVIYKGGVSATQKYLGDKVCF